jgi:hypothetical protein
MTVLRGFIIVILSAAGFGAVGGGIGFLLAVITPDYYGTVFRVQNRNAFNERDVGIGLGVSQGLIAGLVVGLAIVLAVTWYNGRKIRSGADFRDDY